MAIRQHPNRSVVLTLGALGVGLAACIVALAAAHEDASGVEQRIAAHGDDAMKQEVLELAAFAHGQIQTLDVTYRYDSPGAPRQHISARARARLVMAGEQFYKDKEFGRDPVHEDVPVFHRITAFDGERTTIVEAHRRAAQTMKGRDSEAWSHGSPFVTAALLHPPRTGVRYEGQNLLSILASDRSRVRQHLERIGDSDCVVIDLLDSRERPILTIWADPARGYLPVHQAYFRAPDFQHPVTEYVTEDAVEALPGVWLPLRTRILYHTRPAVPELQVGTEYIMQVELDDANEPALAVNVEPGHKLFDLRHRLAPGTLLHDRDTGEMRTVGGQDFRGLADAADR